MKGPRAFAFVLVAAATAGATLALAQQPRSGTHHAAPSRRPPHPADAEAPDAASPHAESPASTGSATRTAAAASRDAGVIEARAVDGGGHVYRFGEVDIEGRVRNPQLVYFLRRVRAEFGAEDLGHRSFMPELTETRKDPNF